MLELAKRIKESSSGIYEIVVAITGKCNFKCSFCYSNSNESTVEEIPLEKLKEIFDEAKSLGVQIVAISGGEPFLHRDFFEILAYAKKCVRVVMVSTNGFFINEEVAKKLKDLKIDNVQLSLEGEKDINDSLRGVKGAYIKAIQALIYLKQNNIDVTLTPTIQKNNYNNIYHVWELAKKYKADMSIKRMVEVGRAGHLDNISSKQYKALYEFGNRENNSGQNDPSKIFIHCDPLRVLFKDPRSINFTRFSGCIAGKALLYIKYNGDVYPCSKLPIRCGNIYKNNLEFIFKNSPAIKKVTARSALKGKCGECVYNLVCGGCRASAYSKYVDVHAEDPLCWEKNLIRTPLYYLTWNVTNRCNLKCKHCYANSGLLSDKELSLFEAQKMIKDAKSLGLKFILFTGGEPFLRRDLFEIMKYAKSLNLNLFLATNGILIEKKHLKHLREYVAKVNISIDYPIESMHDSFRGRKGAFKKAVEAIEMLLENDINVGVSVTVFNKNINYIPDLIQFCKYRGLSLNIKRFIEVGRGKNKAEEQIFSKTEYRRLKQILRSNTYEKVSYKDPIYMCEVAEFGEQSFAGCLAGINILSITATGEIVICTKALKPLGNIRTDNLIKVWNENTILQDLRRRNIGGKCSNCKNILICGGCRAAAHNEYKDLLAQDPLCEFGDKK